MENYTLQGFTSNELLDLDLFLRKQTSGMSLVKAHGFITAIVSFPDLFMPSEWIPILVGDIKPSKDNTPTKPMLDKLITMYQQISANLNSSNKFQFLLSPYQPHLNLDSAPISNVQEWCHGYCLGLVWNETEWLNSEEEFLTKACATFFMLSDLIQHNMQNILVKNLSELVKALHTYWLHKQDSIITRGIQNNEPCPCGSTKKFGNCCLIELAAAVIH